MNIKNNIDFDTIYQSNKCGPFIFLELLGSSGTNNTMARIKFLETGTITDVYLKHALSGNVKDRFKASVYGFGFIGNANSNCREYDIWRKIISRCYNQNDRNYKSYGAKGITVCDRWRSFENFLNDIKSLSGYDLWLQYPGKYELDKDILQINVPTNQKIYSPETCCFVDKITNLKYVTKHKKYNKFNKTSQFAGVSKNSNGPSFRASIMINGNNKNHGSYMTEEAAAFMYDYVCRYYYPNINPNLLNNIPNMTLDEAQAQRRGGKIMCNIVNKEMCKIIHK